MDSSTLPTNVVDLAARRARRHAAQAAQAAGLALYEELRAEADDFIAALVAGGAL